MPRTPTKRAETSPGLQLDEDLAFQRRSWIGQRIGWGLLALVVIAALLGFLGSGPLSGRETSTADFSMRYDWITRHSSPRTLRFDLQARPGNERSLWLDAAYAHRLRIREIAPEPERVVHSGDRVTYVFLADPSRPLTVRMECEQRGAGIVDGRAGVPGGPDTEFTQVVLP